MRLNNFNSKGMSRIFKTAQRNVSFFILFLFLLSLITPIHSSFAGPGKFSWSALDRSRVLEAAKRVTPAVYPDADVAQVDQRKWVKYREDGTYVEWLENYTKILTEKGKRNFNTISSSFTIPYNNTEFKLVEIISKDGKTVVVDIDKNSSVMIERGQMSSNIYNPNSKILQVNIPELSPGDIIHYILFDDFTKVPVPDTWSDYVTFEDINPIIRSEYTVIAPKEKPLKSIALKSEIPGTVTHNKQVKGSEIFYNWVAEDIPRAFLEPEMPPFYTQAQRLLISSIEDWEWISRWYWNLCKPNIEKTSQEMKDMVDQLVGNLNDPHDRIMVIFSWVSQNIRYLGITVEKDAPGYEPHPANMTFDRRAGVCRDKAALLTAMLRLAGLDAYPVLIMNGQKKDPEVPQPFFNHAVTSVRNPDGSYLLMDSTDENTRQLFPAYLNNQSYLVAAPDGEKLSTSPVEPAEQNMMHIETSGGLDKAGNLNAESILRFGGINDNVYRGYFSRLTRDERRGFFENITKKILPGARLKGYQLFPDNMLDTASPLEVHLNFEAKDIRVQGKETCMISIPRLGSSIGMVNYLLGKMGLKKRRFPVVTKIACGVEETVKLDINQSVGNLLSLPRYESVENTGTAWNRNLSLKDNILTSKDVFKMKIPEYSPEQYVTLKETLKKIESNNRRMPIFSAIKSSESEDKREWYDTFSADAVVLEEEIEYNIENETCWTETKRVKIKILTYAGKKMNSDIRIAFNPVWEDVDINNVRVVSQTEEVKVINRQEINIMDAVWVGDAPRYPAAKTMVVSLPGVEVGSIVEYTLIRKKKGRPFFSINGEFYYQEMISRLHTKKTEIPLFSINGSFRYHNPIVKKTVRIKIPDALSLKISRADQGIGLESVWKRTPKQIVEEKERLTGNKKIYEFFATKVAPVNDEDFLPPWYSFNPMVFASTGSWKCFAEDVNETLKKAAVPQTLITDRARELIKGISGKQERIIAIRDFVAKNIKPVFLSICDLPLDQISPAAVTLQDGYGNSADQAVLLHALLSAVGFKPQFVLSSPLSPVENQEDFLKEYPVPEWFNDVLVRVETEKGYIYLNDTDQYALIGTTPSDEHLGLLLENGQIITINVAADQLKDREDLIFEVNLEDDGHVTITETRKFYGSMFASFRKKFTEIQPEERHRHHLEIVASVSQAAEAKGEYVTDYNVYPGIEKFSVTVANYGIRQGKYLYIKIPGLYSSIAGVTRDKRENPLYRGSFNRRHILTEVVLPDEFDSIQHMPPGGISFPVGKTGKIGIETNFLSQAAPLPGDCRCPRVTIEQDIDLKPFIITPENYSQLLETNRLLNHPKAQMLLIKMKEKRERKNTQ